MNKQKIIVLDEKKPYTFLSYKNLSIKKPNHTYLEILYNVKGETKISIDNDEYLMGLDDIIVIKPNQSYHIFDGEYHVLSLLIRLENIVGLSSEKLLSYHCNSCNEINKDQFIKLKQNFTALLKFDNKFVEDNSLASYAYIYSILDEINRSFSSKYSLSNKEKNGITRISDIVTYIDNHYKDNITLADLSDTFHLTIPYLSTFFKKKFNVNFKTYYNEVRLKNAIKLLLSTDLSIDDISYESGFYSSQTFFKVFKERYNETPISYKKKYSHFEIKNDVEEKLSTDIINVIEKSNKTLSSFNEYITIKNNHINLLNPFKLNRRPYNKMIGLGDARDILYKSTQDIIQIIQSEMKYEYGYIRNIFSDELYVVRRTKEGITFSFRYIDEILDYIISQDLKPFIQLGYMPLALASNKDKLLFVNRVNTSEPKSLDEWCSLINALINHLLEHYDIEVLETWIFSPWREPDSDSDVFGFSSLEAFNTFYKATYKTIKKIIPKAVIASPEFMPITPKRVEILEDFITFTKDMNCIPNILCITYYADTMVENVNYNWKTFKDDGKTYLSQNPNRMHEVIQKVKTIMTIQHLRDIPLFVSSYNLTFTHHNLLQDTAFMGPFVVKNTLDNLYDVDCICYWKISDFEDFPDGDSYFPGRMGLYLRHNIPKPQMLAYQYLLRLHKEVIAQGDGFIVTCSHDRQHLLVLLYNYEHYSQKYSNNELYDISPVNRYVAFTQQKDLEVELTIENINDYTSAELSTFFSNRNVGSPFDIWIRMGCPDISRVPEKSAPVRILAANSIPFYIMSFIEIINNKLTIKERLEPFEIRSIVINLKK